MDISYYKRYEPIDGKWYLNKEIGRGAYGVVFEAERRDIIKATRAIKVVSIPASQNEIASYRQENYSLDDKSVTSYFYGFVEEFLKEIQIMSLFLGHRNIVNIEDYDIKERTGEIGWDIFIRMELLTPMNKYFAANKITEKDIIKLGCDICKALEACRQENVIHRDIKPSNIFISSNGDFKLGDFGVARTLEKTSSGLSKKGTYTYMAPEVYKGEAYNASVDIYSLGIVMYKLLNNNLEPFKTGNSFSDEENALIRRMRGEKIVTAPANAGGELANIILKACSYNPEERFLSPAQMRAALENCLNKDYNTVINSNTTKSNSDYDADKSVGIFERDFTPDYYNDSVNQSQKSQNSGLSDVSGAVNSIADTIIINKIMNSIFVKVKSERGIDVAHDKLAVFRIKECLEKRLEQLKSGAPIQINIPFLTVDAEGPYHLEMQGSIDDIDIDLDNNRSDDGNKSYESAQYSYRYSKTNFNDNGSRKEFVPDDEDEGTIGVFSARAPKQNTTPFDSDYGSFDEKNNQQSIHKSGENEPKLDPDIEVSYRYIVEMVKLRNGIDINQDSSIKKIVCDKISLELTDLKNGGIIFLRSDIKSNVCGNFKISVDLSLKNAKCYFVLPVESADEELIKMQVDTCLSNIEIEYSKNNQIEAARLCIMALTYDPKRSNIWRTLGKMYRELGRSVMALECYEKAMELDPNDGITYSSAAVAYFTLGQYVKAKEYAEKAISLLKKAGPDYATACANYSLIEFKLGNKKRAKALLRWAKISGYKKYKSLEEMMK